MSHRILNTVTRSILIISLVALSTSCWWAKDNGVDDPYNGIDAPKVKPTPESPDSIGRALDDNPYADAVRAPESELRTVYFDYDRSEIRADQLSQMEKNAQYLLENTEKRIRIDGHCDERGSLEYNIALGARRAQQVKDFLVSRGVEPARIMTISRGEEDPAVEGTGEAVWSMNRRAEFFYIR
jgi:peptidoglycan-associated lipoprotein